MYLIFLVFISLSGLAYNTYTAIITNFYFCAKSAEKKKDFVKSNTILLKVYDPDNRVFFNESESLALLIANNYLRLDSLNLAREYFKKSLLDMPYMPKNYYEFALFEFRNGNYDASFKLAVDGYKYNKSYIYLLNVLIKSAINLEKVNDANIYLNRLSLLLSKKQIPSYINLLNRRYKELDALTNGLPYDKSLL